MGIELPAELAGVAERVGLRWPEADEDAMREQAVAWRAAERELTTLAADADAAAGGALGAMSGPAADAARQLWSGFVDPDGGTLTGAAEGAGKAAHRLERAAEQVGSAKVEMVRQLVDAASNADAAAGAAEAGYPGALLGLETTLRGTAANLGAVTDGLVHTVGTDAERVLPEEVAPANPGTRGSEGQSGLLGAATGVPAAVVDGARVPVAAALPGQADIPGPAVVIDSLDDAVAPAVPADTRSAVHLAEPVLPVEHPILPAPEPPEADTGPLPLDPAAPTPPRGQYGGLYPPGGFADAPTPPAGVPAAQAPPGQTDLSGFAGGPVPAAAPPGPAPMLPPGAAYGQQPYVPPPGPQPAQPYGPPFGHAPPAPPPPGRQVPHAGFVPGQPPQQPPQPQKPQPPQRAAAGFAAAPRPTQPPQQARPPQQVQPPPQALAPEPVRPQPPAAAVPLGSPRQERESIVALFLVHMFPIGHLPVASDRPARQLPVPGGAAAVPYPPCFPPHDHPRSDVLDPGHALAWLRQGWRQPAPPPASVLPCPPAAVTDGHDPLGGLHERDWDGRYLVREGEPPEYVWPPGERCPEGGRDEGEPVVLEEGTLLDRFGSAAGRVFAADGTPFPRRSLPPAQLEAGYRRYRVRREVPMWSAVSAGWFGQPGGGQRYRAVYSAAELVTMGYLADVTFEEVGQR